MSAVPRWRPREPKGPGGGMGSGAGVTECTSSATSQRSARKQPQLAVVKRTRKSARSFFPRLGGGEDTGSGGRVVRGGGELGEGDEAVEGGLEARRGEQREHQEDGGEHERGRDV